MNLITKGLAWLFLPAHWVSSREFVSIAVRIGEHLLYTGVSVLIAVLIAVPLGLYIGHTGRGRSVAVLICNVSRALPTLGLLALLILFMRSVVIPQLPVGMLPNVIVFVVLGIPPLLAGAYAGIESVDRSTIDAARALGMTELQIVLTVEVPLGFSLIFGGFRAATLQIIATVTLAAYLTFGAPGLGHYLVFGLDSNDIPQLIGGVILVIVLALLVDGILAVIHKLVVPRVSSGMP